MYLVQTPSRGLRSGGRLEEALHDRCDSVRRPFRWGRFSSAVARRGPVHTPNAFQGASRVFSPDPCGYDGWVDPLVRFSSWRMFSSVRGPGDATVFVEREPNTGFKERADSGLSLQVRCSPARQQRKIAGCFTPAIAVESASFLRLVKRGQNATPFHRSKTPSNLVVQRLRDDRRAKTGYQARLSNARFILSPSAPQTWRALSSAWCSTTATIWFTSTDPSRSIVVERRSRNLHSRSWARSFGPRGGNSRAGPAGLLSNSDDVNKAI